MTGFAGKWSFAEIENTYISVDVLLFVSIQVCHNIQRSACLMGSRRFQGPLEWEIPNLMAVIDIQAKVIPHHRYSYFRL